MKKIFLLGYRSVLVLTFLLSGNAAAAATLYVLPVVTSVGVGQEFSVDIKIDTSDASTSINSAEATLKFRAASVSIIGVEKQNSSFSLWVEEPNVSNTDGTLSFTGGTKNGVAGSALQVLRVKFKAIGIGPTNLTFVDAKVLAADGKGTNVLSNTRGALIAVGTAVIPSLSDVGAVPVEQPTPVTRIATVANALPSKPVLRVPLYPDQSRWYNQVGEVIVLWDLPSDVTQVSARVSHVKSGSIGASEKVLANGKSLGVLDEGIWYIAIQFKNNIGWGETAYYKVSVDTTVPLSFGVKIDSAVSDDPSRLIRFETSDSLSGIAGYTVTVDGRKVSATTTTTMRLPIAPPGKHSIVVTANDLAGNSVEDTIGFEVLPLPTPTIEFITPVVAQGEFVLASGKSIPGNFIEVHVVGDDGRDVSRDSVSVASDGHWNFTLKESLAIGHYSLSATTHDDRGAASFARVLPFSVRAKVILSLGFIELGWFELLILLTLLVTTGVSLATFYDLKRKATRGAYATVLGRDVEKLSDLLLGNINELSSLSSTKTETSGPQLTHLITTMNSNVAKLKKYIKQESEKLS